MNDPSEKEGFAPMKEQMQETSGHANDETVYSDEIVYECRTCRASTPIWPGELADILPERVDGTRGINGRQGPDHEMGVCTTFPISSE